MKKNQKLISFRMIRTKSVKARKFLSQFQGRRHRILSREDELSDSFLAVASDQIVRASHEKGIPVIYAEKGIIYKVEDSKKAKLGEIKPVARKISETSYTIDFIRP